MAKVSDNFIGTRYTFSMDSLATIDAGKLLPRDNSLVPIHFMKRTSYDVYAQIKRSTSML